MEPKLFCQSCTMPIDKMEDRGTEKDGSKSSEYCKYCYQDGKFTDPNLTLEGMQKIVATQMNLMNLPQTVLQQSLALLPQLKRWKAENK
ncbi:MAG TPA: zinc ribbon domain-containing protein [Chitinophagaceae bacterium]|nr:zinc ribbon domain-containing protein [Chitinophagaceae bacterium]